MIRELLCDWFRPNWRPPLTAAAPVDVDEIEDELGIEASERGLTGRDRTDWIERQLDDPTSAPKLRIGMYMELHRKETPA